MSDFDIFGYASSGMRAEHFALDVAAQNVALAQTASQGHPVHPLAPSFAAIATSFDPDLPAASNFSDSADDSDGDETDDDDSDITSLDGDPTNLPGAIRVLGTHPRGTATSGIDAVTEMVNVLDAQRAYEFNASVFDAGKKLIQQTLQVGQS